MTEPTYPPVVAILGPTASGKSALALDLATRLDGVIINVDSMQVYRDLRILTARRTMTTWPARRIASMAFRPPTRPVRRPIGRPRLGRNRRRRRGQVPILCGGSGLYFKALTEGLAPIPDISPALRARLRARLADVAAPPFAAEWRPATRPAQRACTTATASA